MNPSRCLVVGAGAVGQVYARHLQKGGAHLTFYVRPKRVPLMGGGLVLHPLNEQRPARLSGYDVVSSAAEVAAAAPFDSVWLTVPSDALRGDWLDALLGAIGEAVVVSLQPGLEDRAYLAERVPEARLVSGMIGLIAWHAPLPGADRAPGIAYWFPPFQKSPLGGCAAAAGEVARLRAGGFPTKVVDDVAADTAFASSLMMPIIAGLEVGGWTFRGLFGGSAITLAVAAARETSAIARPRHRRWWVRRLMRRGVLRMITWLAPRVVPFDLEVYLQAHFTKVGPQTRMMLETYIRLGQAEGWATEAISALLVALRD
jgi:2-dehydropantoate 2-reductase